MPEKNKKIEHSILHDQKITHFFLNKYKKNKKNKLYLIRVIIQIVSSFI